MRGYICTYTRDIFVDIPGVYLYIYQSLKFIDNTKIYQYYTDILCLIVHEFN